MCSPTYRDPNAHTMTASHTDLQVACATAGAALTAWVRVSEGRLGASRHATSPAARLRAFLEAVHAHDFVARFAGPRADGWRRRLASAIELEATNPAVRHAMATARARAAAMGQPS